MAEPLPGMLSHDTPIQCQRTVNQRDELFQGVGVEAGLPDIDDFLHRTSPQRNDRCATGHGFDHDHTESLFSLDGKQEGSGLSQKRVLLALIDRANVDHVPAINQRLDLFSEVSVFFLIQRLAGEH